MPPRPPAARSLRVFLHLLALVGVSACVAGARPTRGGRLGTIYQESCDRPGVLVTDLEAESAAGRAGVMIGDRIVAIAGIGIGPGGVTMGDAIGDHQPGETVLVELLRGDEALAIEVVLGPKGVVWEVVTGGVCP